MAAWTPRWRDRLKARHERWKTARLWRRASPSQQMMTLVQMLHASPELRRLFKDALFGRSAEAGYVERRRAPEPSPAKRPTIVRPGVRSK